MPNVLSGRFCMCSTGQCIPPSTIMQFRRNVYEYSTKNSAYHFRMQSERKQTLVIIVAISSSTVGSQLSGHLGTEGVRISEMSI